MLNPSIGKLIDNYDSRYQLVLDVARCARFVSGKAEEEHTILREKPVTTAINTIAAQQPTKE